MARLSYEDFTPWQQITLARMARDLYYNAKMNPELWARVQAERERLYQIGRLQRPEAENEIGV